MGVFVQAVMFDLPDAVEADLLGQHGLSDAVMKGLPLAGAGRVGHVAVDGWLGATASSPYILVADVTRRARPQSERGIARQGGQPLHVVAPPARQARPAARRVDLVSQQPLFG